MTLLSDSSFNDIGMVKDAVKVGCGFVKDMNIIKGLLEAERLTMYIKEKVRKRNLGSNRLKRLDLDQKAVRERLEETRKELESRKQSLKGKEKALLELDKQQGQDIRSV